MDYKEKRYTMEKLAIIDMGSNSIRFVVLQINDNKSYSFLYQEKNPYASARPYPDGRTERRRHGTGHEMLKGI